MHMMSHLEKKQLAAAGAAAASTAVAGKTARPCDGCARWRARWYCAADDAFLCQSCDSSVHSANPLARRHHRLRIRSSSAAAGGAPDLDEVVPSVPSWLRGFKRKGRTPRSHQYAKKGRTTTDVPELVETSVDENEDEAQQLLYCVPVFDPALAEFRSAPSLDDSNAPTIFSGDEAKPTTVEVSDFAPASASTIDTANQLASILSSDMELAEFAAKMESLLGGGIDGSDDSFSMETLGLVPSMEGDGNDVSCCLDAAAGRLKTEQPEDAEHFPIDLEFDIARETLELDFHLPGSSTAEEDDFDEEKTELVTTVDQQDEEAKKQAKLRLNYEAVISAWSSHGSSPWTGGERPQINLDNCSWIDYMVMWAEGGAVKGARYGGDTGVRLADVGRRARVTRYREKRQTRLFAKKIRYEVRKLNAEKRPRMKGRFVKRAPGVLPH